MRLNTQEQQEINALARQFEQTSGAQAVAAVVGKADDYPDIPWKAFALGVSLAALAVVADEFINPDWASIHTPVRDAALILATGILTAVLSMYVAVFARLFLDRARVADEIRQYAQGMFLQRELFRTRERVGILILVCRFERKVFILPDSGISRHLAPGEIDAVIAVMAPPLAQWQPVHAFRAGFDALTALLASKPFQPQRHGNELPDGTVVEEGSS